MITLSQETEALATRLAASQRMTVDEAIRRALEAQVRVGSVLPVPGKQRDQSAEAIARRMASMTNIAADFAAMPILDPRSPNEIMDDLDSL